MNIVEWFIYGAAFECALRNRDDNWDRTGALAVVARGHLKRGWRPVCGLLGYASPLNVSR